ncbi:ATP-dependent DNA ligase [Rhodococcus opacus]|nr:DNA-ligase (ATP) [Rhodococcus wratislaviensis IFP 2016]
MLSPTTQLRNEAPVTYYVFDVLALDGKSTTGLPYLRRRTELDDLALSGPRLQVPPYRTDVDGEQMLDLARRHHLEGAVAQRVHSTYQPGRRSPAWIKQPLRANTEGIIVGWVDGTGAARDGIGSLLLAA